MPEHYEPVDVAITALPSTGSGSQAFVATHATRSDVTRFLIRLESRVDAVTVEGELSGDFRPPSAPQDATEFLDRLVLAHRAPPVGVSVPRYTSLPFQAKVLGVDLSRVPGSGLIAGECNQEPAGTWIRDAPLYPVD